MENPPEDQKVIELLTKLKDSNGGYPSDMLAARRRTYLRQMANVGLGIGLGAGLKHTLKGGGSSAATVGSKVLETALIAAIAIEAGTAAYLYRDKIANAIRSYISGPATQEVSSSANDDFSTIPVLIETIATPLTPTSGTPSGTPSSTPSISIVDGNTQGDNGQENNGANTGVNANATPDPKDNEGNQYGLTPKPERTKENNGGGDNNSTDDDGGESDSNNGGGGGNNNGGSGSNKNKP